MTIRELMELRAKLIAEMRSILDGAKKDSRDVNPEEDSRYNTIAADVEKLDKQIDREQRQEKLEASLRSSTSDPLTSQSGGFEKSDEKPGQGRASKEYHERFISFLLTGERRDLVQGVSSQGGFVVPSEQFVNSLLKAVDDMVFIRQKATKLQLANAQSLGVPTLEADPADAEWTTELGTGTDDTTMAFGKRALLPNPMAKRVKISNLLLRNGVINVEQLVLGRLAYKFGITEEKGYLTGNGASKPLGVFTASADGIPTTRDVSTGNEQTAMTFDGLLEALFSLKPQYLAKAEWAFNRVAIKNLAKIKDGDGRYMWIPSVTQGVPGTLFGLPVNMSEFVPSTFTQGLYVGIVGDFSQYWIADALNMEVKRLDELYAESNKTGYIGRKESDGQPVMAEAFARVKLAP